MFSFSLNYYIKSSDLDYGPLKMLFWMHSAPCRLRVNGNMTVVILVFLLSGNG